MRFALLGDCHIGVRNDLALFHDHAEVFFDRMILDLVGQGITTVFQLGDLFDRRKYINFNSLSRSKRYLFDRMQMAGITMHTLVGNHDIFLRDSLAINSSTLLLGEYDNIIVHDKPTTINVAGTSIDIIPWICKENEEHIHTFIHNSTSDLCFGHFEIATFQMYRGMESYDGIPTSWFDKYERVMTGHFHTRSTKGNITYVGTPYEMTWQDYNDPKGYHVFDTSTRELTFYQNPIPTFIRLEYDDRLPLPQIDNIDLNNKFVRVVVVQKKDLYKFDQFMQLIYTKGCYEVKVVEDVSEFIEGDIGEDINLEDTMDVLDNYIDSIETSSDKEKVKQYLKGLYLEAVNSGVV